MRYNLKTARRIKGLTPKDMADKLDISLSFYYKIEAGTRDPSLGLAFKIADVLEYDDLRELYERLHYSY